MNSSRAASVLVLVLGIVLGVWLLVDSTPSAWLLRLGTAGAITAGAAAVLYAAVRAVEGGSSS